MIAGNNRDYRSAGRDRACLCFVHAFDQIEGRSPSYAEIAKALNIGKNSAVRVVERLIRSGALERSGAALKRTHHTPGISIRQQHHEAEPRL